MVRSLFIAFAVVFLFAGVAESGPDYWTKDGNVQETIEVFVNTSVEYTAAASGVLKILKTIECGEVLAWTDALTSTLDFEWCMFADGTHCREITTATPITTATEYGLQIDPMAKFLKITLLSGTDITFQAICRP